MTNIKIHKNDAGLVEAISTNATDEAEFLMHAADELQHELERQLGTANDANGDAALFGFVLARALPMVVDICCRLRGYKADVIEHRIIVAGRALPSDIVGAIPEYTMPDGARI